MHWKNVKNAFFGKLEDIVYWASDHKEILVVAVPFMLGIISKGVTAARVSANRKAEKDLRDLYIYDPSLRYHLKLKHRLNAREMRFIRARQRKGETMFDILNSMRVLK